MDTQTQSSPATTILGSHTQIAAEKAALQLLHDPDVVALLAELKAEFSTSPLAQSADGAERLENANNEGLFHGFKIIKLSELDTLEGIARITPAERDRQLIARKLSYYRRFKAE